MNAPDRRGANALETLAALRHQLHMIVPALTVSEGHPEMTPLLAALRDTTVRVEALLRVAEPEALASIRAGFGHAAAAEHNEARTAFLTAYHRLSVLMHADKPRRPEAAHEPTKRWRIER